MARTHINNAQFAVIGKERFDDGSEAGGILYWHDSEPDAKEEATRINNTGGQCSVVPAPELDAYWWKG